MASLKVLFNKVGALQMFDNFQEDKKKKMIEALIFEGNEFVTRARSIDTYKDRTGNLRSSIGFIVYADGQIEHSDFELSKSGDDRNTGLATGKKFAEENVRKGEIALIGVAGMNYAFFVEKNSRDVISGSAPSRADIEDLMKAI